MPVAGTFHSEIDTRQYELPAEVVLQLSHRDVHLGFFKDRKRDVLRLKAGDFLHYGSSVLYDTVSGRPVAKLSINMQGVLADWERKGYKVQSATVRFVVAWRPKDVPKEEAETAVLLPDLTLIRMSGEPQTV